MNPTTRVSTSVRGDIGLLEIAGDVTDISEEPLQNAYREVTAKGAKKLLFKFQPKSFMNSAGIRVMISLAFLAEKGKQALCVTGLSSHMVEVFDLVGLTKYLQIAPTEEAALKHLKSKKA